MRSQNFILLLIACLLTLGVFYWEKIDLKQKISLEVLDLFPQNQKREIIDIYRKFADSKVILVAQNDANSTKEFNSFLSAVQSLPNVKKITTEVFFNQALQDFLIQNYFWIGDLNRKELSSKEIEKDILEKFSQDRLNRIDPLGIIEIPSFYRDLKIGDLPIAIVEMESSEAIEVDKLYKKFTPLAEAYGIKNYFSPLFVSVENPQFILKEVNLLTAMAGIFFIILYFVILRAPILTFNSIATLIFSNLLAILGLLSLYPQVSIMSLSFGIGISNICIDYMMHHHFLGYYLDQKVKFNASVFYGFITTIVGFLVCLFIPFPLLNQLALYAIINLSVAYICFAFLYQKITFTRPKHYSFISKLHFPFIPSWIFLLFSFGMGIYGILHTEKELNLSRLDYQNKTFNAQKDFFASFNEQKTFLIQAKGIDALIDNARQIAKIDPRSVGFLGILPTQKEISARIKYFKSFAFVEKVQRFKEALYQIQKTNPSLARMLRNAYRSFPPAPATLTFEDLQRLGIEVLKEKQGFFFQGSIDDLSKLSSVRGIDTDQAQDLIESITSSIYAPMMSILVLAFVAMILLLLIISGRNFLDSLGFVIFPISCVLFYLSFVSSLNIMHLFAMLVIVVMGVDYGVYSVKEKNNANIRHAMLFSILTTLCSFGFFLLSKTKALSSFGEVIVIGMSCILLLMFFQKNRFNVKS